MIVVRPPIDTTIIQRATIIQQSTLRPYTAVEIRFIIIIIISSSSSSSSKFMRSFSRNRRRTVENLLSGDYRPYVDRSVSLTELLLYLGLSCL